MLRAAAYLLGALVVTTLVHGYLHRRLIRDTDLPRAYGALVLAIAALLPAGMAGLLDMHDLPRAVARPLMACAFLWVGVLLFLLPLLGIGEAARALPASPARRRALARIVALASGAGALALSGASVAIARLPPRVRRVRVPLAGLARPYRLVQISDLHVSAAHGDDLVAELVRMIDGLAPDLVAVTGDLVDGSVRELGARVAALGRARAKDGVFFVTGNHEALSGVDEWVAFLRDLGVRVLRNEHVRLACGVDLVGVDDSSCGGDLDAAVRGRDRARPSVLLAHRPDDVRRAAEHGVALQISGHTHGGQIAPLGWALERVHQPYVYGLHRVGETLLYVTSGAGLWGPPMRLATRAEIVLFDLVPEGPRGG